MSGLKSSSSSSSLGLGHERNHETTCCENWVRSIACPPPWCDQVITLHLSSTHNKLLDLRWEGDHLGELPVRQNLSGWPNASIFSRLQ